MGSCEIAGRAWRQFVMGGLVVVLTGSALPKSVSAQTAGLPPECADVVLLYSPSELAVVFEDLGTKGNRLAWPAVPRSLGSCTGLLYPVQPDGLASPEAALLPAVEGRYQDLFDRRFRFLIGNSGDVGSTVEDLVAVSLINENPNEAAANVSVPLNLSSKGGFFRAEFPAAAMPIATQLNDGIPTYLPSADATALASSADGSRIYAGVLSVPLLRSDDAGQTWFDINPDEAAPFTTSIVDIVVSPLNPDRLWVRTSNEGVWLSVDGGVSWQRDFALTDRTTVSFNVFKYVTSIPPGGTTPEPVLYAHVSGLGLFYSVDDGVSYTQIIGAVTPTIRSEFGQNVIDCNVTVVDTLLTVTDLAPSFSDPSKVYLAVQSWGVYRVDSQSDYTQWEQSFDGMVLCSGQVAQVPLGRTASVERIVSLPGDGPGTPDRLVAFLEASVISVETNIVTGDPDTTRVNAFSSVNDGLVWDPFSLDYPEESGDLAALNDVIRHPDTLNSPRTVVAAIRGKGLWQAEIASGIAGAWAPIDFDPTGQVHNPKVSSLLMLPSNRLMIATSGAGAYRVGEPIDLDRAIALSTDVGVEPVVTGLTVTFNGTGTVFEGQEFHLIGQSFQSYAVWRARTVDRVSGEPEWELLGLYDLSNPESCSEQACDAASIGTIPGCFADKRSQCFVRPADANSGEWQFFDRDVFSGFTYFYAVTTADYGFTGDISPRALTNDFLFSPRSEFESDPASLASFRGLDNGDGDANNFNTRFFQVNLVPAADLGEVFAVPNPFIRQAGWDVGDGVFIRFFNVTETSGIEIYTLAGDFIREVDNVVFDDVETGVIEWDTRNEERELVASGVYIYRVTDDDGNEFLGRLTLIR